MTASTTGKPSASRDEMSRATRATASRTAAAEWSSSAVPMSCRALSGEMGTRDGCRPGMRARPPKRPCLLLLSGTGGIQLPEIGAEFRADLGMLQRYLHVGLQVADLAAAVVAHAVELVREHVFFPQQAGDAVGQLYFAAGTGFRSLQMMENPGRQNIAPH